MAPKALVIVESPSKAKTIKKYLGADYEVTASVGHVKDLPKSKLGVDLEDFEPQYETIRGKGKILTEIRRLAKKVDVVYLAPDPDREGEAIAWHIAAELGIPEDRIKRVLFNEITKKAIVKALENPLELNRPRFDSQQARRILDRLVGYQISPLLWDKVRRGLSAGRVQTVAVRLVAERERAIEAFDQVEYWSIEAGLEGDVLPAFKAKLAQISGKKAELPNGEAAAAVLAATENGPFTVQEIRRRERKQKPQAPFTTSRIQQDAAKRFRFTAKRTMSIAQRLYEGMELGGGETQGLITYMRTDSTRISDDAVADVRAHISETYGAEYLPEKPIIYKSKGRAQDAHEAIRPTSLDLPPEKIAAFVKPDELKLYTLIWKRFVACQMERARYDMTSVDIVAPGEHLFRASGSVMTFPGFTAAYTETKGADDVEEASSTFPPLTEGQVLKFDKVISKQHFTQPPPRFTEATIVKEMEEKGIGRPSTYAAIISTIQDKKYAEKKEGRFHPSELGLIVNDLLTESFPKLFDVNFTATMEDQLDEVEDGVRDWRNLLTEFWGGLSKTIETAKVEMRNVKREEKPTDLKCPKDEGPLVIKFGRNGSFLACSNYPDCKFTGEFTKDAEGVIKLVEDELCDERCPDCEGGELLFKSGRFGRFIGCTNYPDCRHTRPISMGVDCPKCSEGFLTEKRSRRGKTFYSCSTYPKCDYAQWDKPIPKPCPTCENPWMDQKMSRSGPGATTCPKCKTELEELVVI